MVITQKRAYEIYKKLVTRFGIKRANVLFGDFGLKSDVKIKLIARYARETSLRKYRRFSR